MDNKSTGTVFTFAENGKVIQATHDEMDNDFRVALQFIPLEIMRNAIEQSGYTVITDEQAEKHKLGSFSRISEDEEEPDPILEQTGDEATIIIDNITVTVKRTGYGASVAMKNNSGVVLADTDTTFEDADEP